MRSAPRQIGAIGLALLLVATLAINPLGLAALDAADPVGEAEAQEGAGCWVIGMLSPGMNPGQCLMEESDTGEMADWLGVYTEMLTAKSAAESYISTYGNAITDSSDTAFLLGEQAMVQAYLNDSSQAEAKTAARETIRDYYTIRQMNLISAWNTQVASLENAYERNQSVESEPGAISNWFEWNTELDYGEEYIGNPTFMARNVTLSNGSEMEVRQVAVDMRTYWNSYNTYTYEMDIVSPSDTHSYIDSPDWTVTLGQVNFDAPPNTEYGNYIYYKPVLDWNDLWDKTDAKRSEVSGEVDTLVEGTYAEFEAGNVNATELLSRLNLMENYQVDVGDNATFNDVVAALSAQGFSTPESSTGWMNISYDPVEVSGNYTVTNDGMLLSGTAPPNETWEIGTEYDARNLDGAQLVATLDGEQHTINTTFTIHGAYHANGTVIDDPEITSPERDYSVANVSELNDQIALLGDEIARLQNMTATDGGGGGDGGIGWQWSGLDIPNFLGFLGEIGKWVQIGLVAFVGLLVLRVVGK